MMPLLLMLAAPQAAAAPDHFCSGLSSIALRPGETMTRQEGPDFTVFYVQGAGADFGVYAGNYAQVMNDARTQFMKRGGLTVMRVADHGDFHGYLVTDAHGLQNHFFGSVFKGDDGDAAFFDRVRFGPCTAP
ncbi:MAG: hypothetical protein WDN44_12335 [Sphingomonas sp.]